MVYGCSIIPQCPEGSRVIIHEEFPKTMTPDSAQWSIVKYSDLENYCRRYHLSYVGSFENYHLIYWYDKVLPFPQAEFRFAIPLNQFVPDSGFQYVDRANVPEKYKFQRLIK